MEQEYVIGVTNKFAAFLDESEDPYEIIRNVEAEKLRKKAIKIQANSENRDNKDKTLSSKPKQIVRKPAAKGTDRVPPIEKNDKSDNNADNVKQRRKHEDGQSQGFIENPRGGTIREKTEGSSTRGTRNEFSKGEKREGPRIFRGEGDRRAPRSDNDSRPPRQAGEGDTRPARRERVATNFDVESRQDRRPPFRGRGGNRPGFPRTNDFQRKRDFDRRSGSDRTGIKPIDKRDGAGAYNWDSNKDVEAIAATELNVSQQSNEVEDNWGDKEKEGSPTPTPAKEETVEDAETPTADEPEELTLDEYRRRRGQREMPHFDIRKPGEGEDLSQWKGMIEIKKKDTEQETDDDLEISEFPQRAGRQRHVVGIDITFSDSFRSGRGRGRGSGPGRGKGRGDGRSFREDRRDRQSAPKVDDEKAFPSLG